MRSDLDIPSRFFPPQGQADVAAMADLIIRCRERELTLSKQLIGDLAIEPLLVGIDRQEEVNPLLLELPKHTYCVGSASAWMSTSSRSNSQRTSAARHDRGPLLLRRRPERSPNPRPRVEGHLSDKH